jgi:hypothetical protein
MQQMTSGLTPNGRHAPPGEGEPTREAGLEPLIVSEYFA